MSVNESFRITITVDKRTYDKVTELALRMGASQSKMASMLLEAGIEDNEWVIKVVTSRVVKGLREALEGKRKPKRGDA